MKRLIRYLTLGVGVGFVTLVLSVTSARPALAQLAQPTHQAILDAINSLSASVNSALSGIQTSLNTLVAEGQSNVRVTSPLRGLSYVCSVVNVSDTPKTVETKLEGRAAAADPTPTIYRIDTQTVAPGAGFAIEALAHGPAYCTFTIQDGSRSDIRGSIEVSQDVNFTSGIRALSAE